MARALDHSEIEPNDHPFAQRMAQLATQFSAAHGSTGSRLLSGQAQIISELERAIADFHQTEAALLFNLVLMRIWAPRGDWQPTRYFYMMICATPA